MHLRQPHAHALGFLVVHAVHHAPKLLPVQLQDYCDIAVPARESSRSKTACHGPLDFGDGRLYVGPAPLVAQHRQEFPVRRDHRTLGQSRNAVSGNVRHGSGAVAASTGLPPSKGACVRNVNRYASVAK